MTRPRRRRFQRALLGPEPFRGLPGVVRAACVIFVVAFVVATVVDFLFSVAAGRPRDGLVDHLVIAAIFAVVFTGVYTWRQLHE